MSDFVFGEVDWNSADAGGEKTSDFMRLSEGENTVRVMGNPVQYYTHWLVLPDKSKRKVVSPIESPELVRRLEDTGFKRQARWLVKVLDRADNRFKILEIGPQIYNAIKSLFNNARWGKVTAYDITIVKAPKGTQPLYSVTPNPKEALPAQFKDQFIEFNDRINMDKFISPTPAKEVLDLMGWQQQAKPAQGGRPAPQPAAEEDEFSFDFE